MKHFFGFLAMLLPVLMNAQTSVKPIKTGDLLPEMPVIPIINYSQPIVSLNSFSSELVILDFWATWCAPCVKALPDLQNLQKQFGERVQFVLTTPQEKNTIQKFLTDKKIILPSFVDDKILSAYFPHNSVPHEVWIRKDKVIAITYAEQVTAENIQKVLDGVAVNFTEKKANFDYNIYQPLLVGGNGGSGDDLLYHSVITGFLDGIGSAGGVMTDSMKRYKIRAINASVARLYATAAQRDEPFFSLPNRTIIEATNREQLLPIGQPEYTPSLRKFFYCYELAIPAAEKDHAGRFMMEDLNRYFGMVYQIHGTIEERKVRCWVLRKEDTLVPIYTKNNKPSITEKNGEALWVNQPFSSFFYALAYIHKGQPHPFIDSTGITGNVDVEFPLSPGDIRVLQSYLKKYRLRLSLEETDIRMLVIKNNH